jgi:hypothetical protein
MEGKAGEEKEDEGQQGYKMRSIYAKHRLGRECTRRQMKEERKVKSKGELSVTNIMLNPPLVVILPEQKFCMTAPYL